MHKKIMYIFVITILLLKVVIEIGDVCFKSKIREQKNGKF